MTCRRVLGGKMSKMSTMHPMRDLGDILPSWWRPLRAPGVNRCHTYRPLLWSETISFFYFPLPLANQSLCVYQVNRPEQSRLTLFTPSLGMETKNHRHLETKMGTEPFVVITVTVSTRKLTFSGRSTRFISYPPEKKIRRSVTPDC